MMNVTFLTASVSRAAGGLFTSVRRTAQSLQENGLDVRVVGLEDRFTADDLKNWKSVQPQTVSILGPRFLGYSPALSRTIARVNTDLLHSQGIWTYTSRVAANWTRNTHRPHLVSPRGMLDPWALANSRWKKRLAGWCYENSHLSRAACIHALCRSEADSIRAYGLRNPICIIPNGVDVPASMDAGPAPWSAEIKPDRKVLLFLGRLHPKKGLSNLLSAWASLGRQRETAEWELVIAGWDQRSHQRELELQCQLLGIGDSVHFIGPQFGEHKHACYAGCSAAVLPSFSEGFPMAVLEPWAYEKPVLMTPECNIPEGFAANAALKVETSSDKIAEGIRQLISLSSSERQAIGRNGRQLVDDRFNWRTVARQMKSVYSWLLNGGPMPECVVLD
jgi:glycosyltransferase involved in cell wall biosynthesis